MVDATVDPLSGLWKPNTTLKGLFYGPGVVRQHLISCLPSETSSKAFIVTGSSLASKTPLVRQVEEILGGGGGGAGQGGAAGAGAGAGRGRHAGTFSNIREHAPVAQLDEATAQVQADASIDTIIAIGGGSPIDSAKAISFRVHEKTGKFLHHIVIPTTLSAAECTANAGFTRADGVKTGVAHPQLLASYILYDTDFARYTPPELFASTGIRALDHAVELQYHPTASLVAHRNGLLAIQDLFELLPRYRANPSAADDDTLTRLFLAAYTSLGFLGLNTRGPLGLSHSLGYALGSPYGIPHGRTSCLTLGNVVKLKAAASKADAARIARILPFIGETPSSSGDVVADATRVGDRINQLVADLGFKTTLTAIGVGKDQVDIIVARATGGLKASDELTEEQKKLHTAVKELVKNLY